MNLRRELESLATFASRRPLPDGKLSSAQEDYALRFASQVVGTSLSWADVEDSIGASIYFSLSRMEEVLSRERDQWGNWDWQYCAAQRRGELYIPWLDRPLAELRRKIQREQPDRRLEPIWPENKPFALCLTHDVDFVSRYETWRTALRGALHFCRYRPPGIQFFLRLGGLCWRWLTRPISGDPLWHYEDWLKLEDRHGFRSTFFFFPSRLGHPHYHDCRYRMGDLIRYDKRRMSVGEMMRVFSESGWEVGLHGSYHSALETGLLANEREQIEQVVGRPVISTRQHYLHYECSHTPRLQAEAGLKVDSTQGFNRSIGFRAGTSFPYWCWDHHAGQALPVLEIPQHVMDCALFAAHCLEYGEDLAIRHCVELMDEVQSVGGCLTLSWHPNFLNDPIWWNVYKTLLEEAARRHAWGCSAGELHQWWIAREQRISASEEIAGMCTNAARDRTDGSTNHAENNTSAPVSPPRSQALPGTALP